MKVSSKLFYLSAFVALQYFSLVSSDAIDFIDCGTNGIIYSVNFDGCEEAPCEAYRGTTVTGSVTFESGADTEYCDCELYGIIDGITLEFPGGCANVDACLDFEDGCPVEAGQVVDYHLELKVLQTYPVGPVTGRWTLLDDNTDLLLCFEIEIVIV